MVAPLGVDGESTDEAGGAVEADLETVSDHEELLTGIGHAHPDLIVAPVDDSGPVDPQPGYPIGSR